MQEHDFGLEDMGEAFVDKDFATPIYPPSFHEFEKHITNLRPREYLHEIALEQEIKRIKEEKKNDFRVKRSSTRLSVRGFDSLNSSVAVGQTPGSSYHYFCYFEQESLLDY